jgi:N-acetylneuraminic acid mutarotase
VKPKTASRSYKRWVSSGTLVRDGRVTVEHRMRRNETHKPVIRFQHKQIGHFVCSKTIKRSGMKARKSFVTSLLPLLSIWLETMIKKQPRAARCFSWLSTYSGYIKPSHYRGAQRWVYRGAVLVGLAVLIMPVLEPLLDMHVNASRYHLTANATKLIGQPNQNLTKNFTYDAATSSYYYNKKAIAMGTGTSSVMKYEIGGSGKDDSSLYSVKFAADPTQGITYYDNSLNVSFTMVPEFRVVGVNETNGRMVYSLPGGSQIVYTPKANGLKQDLILNTVQGPTQSYAYKLVLPDTLSAQVIPASSGEIGVYSADPALYGNISYGSDTSQASVMQGRVNDPKTNLVFIVPAPSIKQLFGTTAVSPEASATLTGSNFTVNVSHLPASGYPLDIDPSVVVSGSTGFSSGNNEGSIAFTTGINRGPVSGGTISSGWTTNTNPLPVALYAATSVVYSGYVYYMGGITSSGSNVASTYYATISSSGGIGTWASTTSLPASINYASSIAYNGYIYEFGGENSSSAALATTYYAPLNANGTIGTWNTTTTLPTAVYAASSVVYNGYVYEIGGYNSSAGGSVSTTYYAPLNANGTIGTWNTSTSLPVALYKASTALYDGYLYVMGGVTTSTTVATTYYAPLNANGTIGTWNTSTSLPQTLSAPSSVVFGGYIYTIGGYNPSSNCQSTVYYAQVDPAGVTTAYSATTNLPEITSSASVAVSQGYIYLLGGTSSSGSTTNTYYATLSSNGIIGSWTSTTALPTALVGANTQIYNGYIYELGGSSSSGSTATTYYAPLNANGTIGSWTTTTALPQAVQYATSAIYNGDLYVLGGYGTALISATYYAPLNANGTIGSWTTTTALPQAIDDSGSVINDNYIYEIGGNNSSGAISATYYAAINSSGTIGSWTTTTALPQAVEQAAAVVSDGYVYEVGGALASTSSAIATTYYAPLNANGTIGTWNTTTTLGQAAAVPDAAAYDGYIYELGGRNASNNSLVTTYSAQINNGGSGVLGTWGSTTALPVALYQATSVVYNGYVYEIGGQNSAGNAVATSYYAPLSSSGTIGSWTTTTSIPVALYGATSVVYNGYVYEIGGQNSAGNAVATSYYAPLSSSGTIGSWTTTTALPEVTYYASSVIYNGYLYEMGGKPTTSSNYANVYYAPLNANGTIGSWTASDALPIPVRSLSAIAYDGYLYAFGGYSAGAAQSSVYYAPISANGTIGAWTLTTALPGTGRYASSVEYNGNAYVIGGYNSVAKASTYSSVLSAIPRIAQYSTLINLGSYYSITGVSYVGTFPALSYTGNSTAIQYETAGASSVLSAPQPATSNFSYGACTTGTGTSAQYAWLFVTLDDTNNSVFPDSTATTNANLTSLTLSYTAITHPSPNQRLRLGQTLQNGVLSALDTCTP